MFNNKRLSLARKRRCYTAKKLSKKADLSEITVSRIMNGEKPDDDTIAKIANALSYPIDFFYRDDPESLEVNAVSFRSLTKMKAYERDSAISAGEIGIELNYWMESQFDLPKVNLIPLHRETNIETAAQSLRDFWGLGEKPISNMIGLLEYNGIRVLSLAENTANVDAFSFWNGDKPFVFLNNFKTAEHSIFCAAHELGHLVLHREEGTPSRAAEREANLFASAFLMPRNDIRARMSKFNTVDTIIRAKKRWRVSAMALAYRLHSLNLMSEWQYKSTCIKLGQLGYRLSEPDGIKREVSIIWQKILRQLWAEKLTKQDIAISLNLPLDEVEALIWSLTEHDNKKPDINNSKVTIKLVG